MSGTLAVRRRPWSLATTWTTWRLDITAEEERAPGYGEGLERLLPVIHLTTALRQERERLRLSAEEVAERAGLQPDQVEAIDDNDVDVPVESVARYAAAVGLRLGLQPLSA